MKTEPVAIFTAITTAYGAAVAAGWVPPTAVAWIVAGLFAGFGVLVRQNVTPVD